MIKRSENGPQICRLLDYKREPSYGNPEQNCYLLVELNVCHLQRGRRSREGEPHCHGHDRANPATTRLCLRSRFHDARIMPGTRSVASEKRAVQPTFPPVKRVD